MIFRWAVVGEAASSRYNQPDLTPALRFYMPIKTKSRTRNALADIVAWCDVLPGWQQDALRRIVENCELTVEDIRELVALCKYAHGLEVDVVPEIRPLTGEHVPKGLPAGKAVTLCSIAEPENVNALDHTQELTFKSTGLTVVFGYNGSGKSSYGRILRRACRSQHRVADPPERIAGRCLGGGDRSHHIRT